MWRGEGGVGQWRDEVGGMERCRRDGRGGILGFTHPRGEFRY